MLEAQIWTPYEAEEIAFKGYKELRDEVRRRAHQAIGDDRAKERAALLDVVFLMDRWRDEMAARFGVDSPAGPARPDLLDTDAPRGTCRQLDRAAANRPQHARWAS